jgi:hypothetical protein
MLVMTWNKLIKRSVYIKVYFPLKNIIWGEDVIQAIQIAYHSKSAVFIPENLYFHRPEGNSFISKPISEIRAMIIIIKTLEILFNDNIPINIKNIFCVFMKCSNVDYNFFLLDKKQRREFSKELKIFLPDIIKLEEDKNLRKHMLLANKGIMLPFWLRYKSGYK